MTDILLKLSNFAGSTVNLIVGCKLFKTFFKALSPVQNVIGENHHPYIC